MVQTSAPATDRHAARRLEILRRAAAVFRDKGYHRAGMREIAEGLGLQPGALYHYFASKDDLLFACQDLSLTRLLEGGRAIAALAVGPSEKLRRIVRLHLAQTLEATGASPAHLEFDALPAHHRTALVGRRDAYERAVRGVVEEGVREGLFGEVSPKLATLSLLGALNWSVVWWRPGRGWKVEEVADRIADLFLDGLRKRSDEETIA